MITPEVPCGFGFTRAVLVVAAFAITAAGLVWLWVAGHEIEILAAILAAVVVGVAADLFGRFARGLHRRVAERLGRFRKTDAA